MSVKYSFRGLSVCSDNSQYAPSRILTIPYFIFTPSVGHKVYYSGFKSIDCFTLNQLSEILSSVWITRIHNLILYSICTLFFKNFPLIVSFYHLSLYPRFKLPHITSFTIYKASNFACTKQCPRKRNVNRIGTRKTDLGPHHMFRVRKKS